MQQLDVRSFSDGIILRLCLSIPVVLFVIHIYVCLQRGHMQRKRKNVLVTP
jgi:hypothetical protein